jgi:hypothetical protein
MSIPDEVMPVAPSTDVGSERLAAALAAMDVPAIGRALRQDYVIVPLTRGPAGETQTKVVEDDDPEDERRWALLLFSSTAAFATYLGDSSEREFDIRTGSSLAPFIEQYRHLLRRVVFDPAGPHPVQASVEDVLWSLTPDASDDDVAWITDGEATTSIGLRPGERVIGLELPLGHDWTSVDLTDPKRIEKDVSALVKAQLAGLPRAPSLRGQLTAWLGSTARRAAGAGGQRMAFLTRRSQTAAAALSVVQYWHELGEPGDHLDAQITRLRAAGGEQQLAEATTPAGRFVRQVHRVPGPAELALRPILTLDYWLEFPDRRGLCLLSFATPHQDALDAIARLADNVVLSARWVLAPDEGTVGR